MTRILSIGQNQGITIMILNLAPLRSYHLDTLSSLNVSSRAKRIEVREIENEIVFTRPTGKTSSVNGLSVKRQPLRPLANAHNTHPSVNCQKGEKPFKSFSVYTDKGRSSSRSTSNSQSHTKPNSSQKRPSECPIQSRPTKLTKYNSGEVKLDASISSEKIEKIIEQKVQEALASRSLDKLDAHNAIGVNESLQRRLEALEKKIETGEAEESKVDGLRYLIMAKQHKERGEDSSALKMYELAVPFFPGQEKLQRKIEGLKAKIHAKKKATLAVEPITNLMTISPIHCLSKNEISPKSSKNPSRKTPRKLGSNADNDIFKDFLTEDDKSEKFNNKVKAKKAKVMPSLNSVLEIKVDEVTTPRTRHLLSIINSRNLTMIKGLHGVGAKKARDLVEHMKLHREGDDIRSMNELIAIPGLGKRGVERAYEGITALHL